MPEETANAATLGFYFYKGSVDIFSEKPIEAEAALQEISTKLGELTDARHLAFLLGAGCSSYVVPNPTADNPTGKKEVGIPTMLPLAKEFISGTATDEFKLNDNDKAVLRDAYGINVTQPPFNTNLEKLLETLFSIRFGYQNANRTRADLEFLEELGDETAAGQIERFDIHALNNATLEGIIKKTKLFILNRVLGDGFPDNSVVSLYRTFFRKLVYRTSTLSKPFIFTTNYDLFSEKALDSLGIIFSNGFSGVIERFFNPSVFNYAFAEKIDTTSRKWNAIENYVYLYKLHGSVNWVEDTGFNKLFSIRELQADTFEQLKDRENLMIYPSPLKQNASLGSPYSDLFREFQIRMMREQTVLITLGYSFSDEHINNLIYQALTIPTFRLVVFSDCAIPAIKKLIELDDPRIWVIGGEFENECIHYFKFAVERLLPDLPERRIEESIEKVIVNLIRGPRGAN